MKTLSHTVFATQHLSNTHHLSHTLFHTPFSHSFVTCKFDRPSFTQSSITWNSVTHHLCHTACFKQTYNIGTHKLCHPQPLPHTILQTQVCQTQLCHRSSVTRYFATHTIHHTRHLLHKTLSQTTLSHTFLSHTMFVTQNFVAHHLLHIAMWSLSDATSVTHHLWPTFSFHATL